MYRSRSPNVKLVVQPLFGAHSQMVLSVSLIVAQQLLFNWLPQHYVEIAVHIIDVILASQLVLKLDYTINEPKLISVNSSLNTS